MQIVKRMNVKAVPFILISEFLLLHSYFRFLRSLQFPAQHLHHLPDRLLIPSIPAPLPVFGGLDQSSFGEDRHVMRNRRLRKPDAFLNVATA